MAGIERDIQVLVDKLKQMHEEKDAARKSGVADLFGEKIAIHRK